ncbi:MAG TPA: TonB family protein [Acidobacteriaceae bacterium]|nr:TonB family protein [Acidobacteriaceae bacterium]
MFEDSLMESTGRIRTRSRRYAVGTTLLEAALVATLALIPYLYPDTLPRRYLDLRLIAPPPPSLSVAAEPRTTNTTMASPQMLATTIMAPAHIPTHIAMTGDQPPQPGIPGNVNVGQGNAPLNLPWTGTAIQPPAVERARPAGPVRISAGVAEGQLIMPIQPEYPAIALATRTEGTVVIAATISTEGRIENLRVVSGPPLLINAAVEAIRRARYRPFLLNGQPVEVETTIRVEFTLNGR